MSNSPAGSEPTQEEEDRIRRYLARGRVAEAYRAIEDARAKWPDSLDLIALHAEALEKLGMRERALELLRSTGADQHREVLGSTAAMVKREALEASSPEAIDAGLREALRLYEAGWQKLHNIWLGINAATLRFALGDREGARALVPKVLELLEREQDRRDRIWVPATRAEAHLVLEDAPAALQQYRDVRDGVARAQDWGILATVRKNARLVLERAPEDSPLRDVTEDILAALRVPPVVLAVGHIADATGRSPPRLPPAVLPSLRAEIQRALDDRGVSFGFSSLAAGTDLLFQEELAERGVHRHVVLPCSREPFVAESVRGRPDYPWEEKFEALHDGAVVYEVSRHRFQEDAFSFRFANEVQLGLALLEADRLETGLEGMVVWDGRRGDGPGGTRSVLQLWDASGHVPRFTHISTQTLSGWETAAEPPLPAETDPEPWPESAASFERGSSAIAGLVFADAKGFSGLDEPQIHTFVERYLGRVGEVQRDYEAQIFEKNTWGDGLFYVFKDLDACGRFAIDLAEHLADAKDELTEMGLPNHMGLRLALHAGPIRVVHDPVTGRERCSGSAISFAARIEPITPVNAVYASEPFAALARVRNCRGFICRHVGRRDLAKGYGTATLYHLERPPRGPSVSSG